MTSTTIVRAAVLAAALCLVTSACSTPPPEALVRQTAPPPVTVDPAQPCKRAAPEAAPADEPASTGVEAKFDRATNTIALTGGEDVSLAALSKAVGNPAALKELAPGEWLLGANLDILSGASMKIAAPAARWLKMTSGPTGFVAVQVLGGGLDVDGTCVTSWEVAQNRADTDHTKGANGTKGRPYLLARDGAKMNINRAELRYLGYGEVESYGLSWRTEGTTGRITDSIVSHLYYGLYSFGVGGLVVTGNEIHDNVLYGVDPHTGSHDMTIERNTVHDNGKHGIILAENCTNSSIKQNVVYRNQHHGIVMYLHSNNNVIEQNDTFDNAVQGININESSDNVIRGNRVYDNAESGIGIGQTAEGTVVEGNQIRGNRQDGVRLVSEASGTTVRDNVIGENSRYGVYVDSDGAFDITGNTIFGSRIGALLKGANESLSGGNSIYENRDGDVKNDG